MQEVILIQCDQEGTKAKYDPIQHEEHAISETMSKPKKVTSPQRFPVSRVNKPQSVCSNEIVHTHIHTHTHTYTHTHTHTHTYIHTHTHTHIHTHTL